MENNDRLEEPKEKYSKAQEGKWYTIEEAEAITHRKIRERYASYNRRASNK